MKILIPFIIILGIIACNGSDLVSDPLAPHPKVTSGPTPVGSPVVIIMGQSDCGNANWASLTAEPLDETALGETPDAWKCFWLCAIDPGNPNDPLHYTADPNPPHEVIKFFDTDYPDIYQFDQTYYLPCNTAIP